MVLDKKQKILLISFIVIILITIGLLFWNYSSGIIETKSPQALGQPSQADFSIFQDPRFKELDRQNQTEIDIGQIGRDNPFAP
ncbi:MAG: hypothetical protein COX44_00865 [Candidatus Portnoybacteria bacterium CG23_combo_of_CG06-09_8_20_14_all_37_13]|uniref:Uncharacterized protein n=1 Tax=Candidatus Portnoybacteria bacterium CG23_combo_of_CG06-09_8_20_14_all_37_13 TaxID=1974819 RepID=A0A2G9YDE8_9BACT|nr:MAG: hypothetical protein COX44_00865 [Candidatus Portnoybacteria bacterium CG23_combo_of_CG06-09_8_20_14_all_37_13]